MRHNKPSDLAGTTVKIANDLQTNPPVAKGSEFHVEDWWDRVAGKSWQICDGNIACLIYAARSATAGIPMDDEVVYGKVGLLGHLVHVSEIATT